MDDPQPQIETIFFQPRSKRDRDGKLSDNLTSLFSLNNSTEEENLRCLFCHPAEKRVREKSILIAKRLVESKFKTLSEEIDQLKQSQFQLSSNYEIDALFYQHALNQLNCFFLNPSLKRSILFFSMPLLNAWTEKLIRSSLFLSKKEHINHLHIQQTVVAALLHPLRQNVGSCFATAPAIYIQCEQMHQLIQDLEDLLSLGILRRTFSGNEHVVPISTSWGPGFLNKPLLVQSKSDLKESAELIHCLENLKILDAKDPLEKKQKNLEEKFIAKLSLLEGEKVSLYQVIRQILLIHYNLKEDELTVLLTPTLQPKVADFVQISHGIVSSYNRTEKFEESLKDAQYSLINYCENPLLKTWEYTFASFGETQSDFYRWNLFTSLGFDAKKPFGLAQCIYKALEKELQNIEEKIKLHSQEYEQEYFRVKMLEKRVVDVESEQMANWARLEYQNHLHEFNFHRKHRDMYIDKREAVSLLLPKILKGFDRFFPLYFQEVYDASMQQLNQSVLEDSPAGFRLLFKHGRQDPSMWSFIHTQEEFIESLKEFFINTEYEMSKDPEIEEFKDLYRSIVTELVSLIQTQEFILASFERICERYQISFPKDDLSQLEKWPYKPWCYISGGTMENLLQHYFKRELEFSAQRKKIANETELFAFIVETLRQMPADQIAQYKKRPNDSLLMYSPGHVFLFKPGWLPLKSLWNQELYSYSWIRDYIVDPQIQFLSTLKVTPLEIGYFLDAHMGFHPYLRAWLQENISWPSYPVIISEFRQLIVDCLEKIPPNLAPFAISLETIDHWIYQCFPMTSSKDLFFNCQKCLQALPLDPGALKKAVEIAEKATHLLQTGQWVASTELLEILKTVIGATFKKASFSFDWEKELLEVMRKERLFLPKPLLFADSNWPHFYFAFVVNPATLKLEMWRVNSLGNQGFPMHQWKMWFDENHPQEWGILDSSSEYSSASLIR